MRWSWPTRPTVSPKSPEVIVSQRRAAPAPSPPAGDSDKATPIGDPPGQHAASAPAAAIDQAAATIDRPTAPAAPAAGPARVKAPSGRQRTRRIASPSGDGDGVELVEARSVPIQKATDLGMVRVLKHGNLYLLTDPFGDIHPDSRGLGLYHSDTRLVSCCALRVGGVRPVLLQGSMGGNYRGSIQLTNPSADRNPDAKVHP